MHEAVTVGMVLWAVFDIGCVVGVLALIAVALKIIGSGWNH